MRTKTERVIAYAEHEEDCKVTITETYLGTGWTEEGEWGHTFSKYRYTVTSEDLEPYSEWNGEIESHSYRSVLQAYNKFKEIIANTKNGLGESRFEKVFLCEGFEEDYEEDLDPYYDYRSERLDYAGHPWDAPGMCVSDFISGVIYN